MQVNAIDVKSNYVKNTKIGATPIKPQSFGHDDEAENNNSTKKAVLIGGAVLAAAVAAYFMFRGKKAPNIEPPKPTPKPTPTPTSKPLMLTWDGKIGDTMLGEFSNWQIREGLPRVAKNNVKRPDEIFTSPYKLTKTKAGNGNIIESYIYDGSKSPEILIELDKDGNILSQRTIQGNIGTLSNFDKSGLMNYKRIIEFDPAIKGKVVNITEIFDDGIQRSKIRTMFDVAKVERLTITDSRTNKTILRENKENGILTGHIKYDSDGEIIEQFNPETNQVQKIVKA